MGKTNKITGIRSWPEEDRPREKLLKKGAGVLSNSELLSILLRPGTKGASAIDLTRKVLKKFDSFRNMAHTDARDWKEVKGLPCIFHGSSQTSRTVRDTPIAKLNRNDLIYRPFGWIFPRPGEISRLGGAKIAHIQASLEIGRRFREDEVNSGKQKISSAKDIAGILVPRMRDLKTEVFKVVYLDSNNRIINITDAATGTVNQAMPIVREIIHSALQKFAASIICAHNLLQVILNQAKRIGISPESYAKLEKSCR